MGKRAVPYREVNWRESRGERPYDPCADGHSDERIEMTDWMKFTYSACARCGKSPDPQELLTSLLEYESLLP
jgi:hypothetical protein